MVSGLVGFLIWLIIVGFIVWVLLLVLDRIPFDATYKQVAKGLVLVVALVILLVKLVPFVSGLG